MSKETRMRLVIKGSEWGRGVLSNSELYDGERFCCLGIHARACGVGPDDMYGLGLPGHLLDEEIEVPEPYRAAWIPDGASPHDIVDGSSGAAWDAANINDDTAISDEERIAKLRPLFREVGVTIVWRPDL